MISQVLAVDPKNLSDFYAPAKSLGGSSAQISTLLAPIITNIIIGSGVFAFFVIIFAGFTYLTGAGDKNKVAQASNMLNYGILGLVLVVAAYLITRVIGAMIGFDFLDPTI